MFYIKCGGFFFVSYDEETDEQIYSTGKSSAHKYETLEDADEAAIKFNLQGYCVSALD